MDLPIDFINRTKELLGTMELNDLINELESIPPTSIRINPFKWKNAINAKDISWSRHAYYLEQRKPFTFDPLFHAGAYYVQEASSMFLDNVLKECINAPVTALDLCAAPGGKSTLIRSALPEGSLLFTNEYIKNRSQVLAENMIKWGNNDIIVTNNAPSDYSSFTGLFDFILADVPCSGEGMFRKDGNAISEWSVDNVKTCQERQRGIIRDIWPTLKDGGIMVYSTCTYNREENEDNVKWIINELGAELMNIPVSPSWNITGSLTDADMHVYRFLPHKTVGEGLFMAVLRKVNHENGYEYNADYIAANDRTRAKKKKNSSKQTKPNSIPQQIKEWINDNKNYIFTNDGTTIEAFPSKYENIYELVKDKLHIIHKGIQIAQIKGHDIIPSHSLAMSLQLNKEAFYSIELDYQQAIQYLRKEAISVDTSHPKGYVLFTYRNIPIGFAKNIGNRTNNLYPQEWRIRSGYPPQTDPQVI